MFQSMSGCTGGNVGLMGEIANTVYHGLGEESVIGVIPEALQPREVHLHWNRNLLSLQLVSEVLHLYTFCCPIFGYHYLSSFWCRMHGLLDEMHRCGKRRSLERQ